MTKAKVVHPGGFVRTTLLSNRFRPADERCSQCRRATCGWYWFHLKTRLIVCPTCMPDPWTSHVELPPSDHHM